MPKEIYITEIDKERIKKLIDEERKSGNVLSKSMKILDQEINRANIVPSHQIPTNIITMNSRVLLYMDNEEVEISLVYPENEDWSNNMMSVLSPIGTAILGYMVGDTIEWEVPSGVTQIQIQKVFYQPEASGDYHL